MSAAAGTRGLTVAVASGKGGTGKTTVAVNLAAAAKFVQLLDCDVEEPNAHLFLKPSITARQRVAVQVPRVNRVRCTYCGKCAEFCRYNAIAVVGSEVLLFPELCHACGGCMLVCPENAIREDPYEIGVMEKGTAGHVRFAHGRLHTGKPVGIPIIKKVKAQAEPGGTVIIDSPPGTSCSMVESVENVDFCVLVTEPTPFGLNDLKLAVEALCRFRIPFGVVINRDGAGNDETERYCAQEEIPVLAKIPHDERIARTYAGGGIIVEALPEYKTLFTGLFARIKEMAAAGRGAA